MITKVLIPIDFGSGSIAVAREAVDLAGHLAVCRHRRLRT
jgi:hypothetical protein